MTEGSEEDVVRTLVEHVKENAAGYSLSRLVSEIDQRCQADSREDNSQTALDDRTGTDSADVASHLSKAHIWTLLTNSPNISIGFERQFNSITWPNLKTLDTEHVWAYYACEGSSLTQTVDSIEPTTPAVDGHVSSIIAARIEDEARVNGRSRRGSSKSKTEIRDPNWANTEHIQGSGRVRRAASASSTYQTHSSRSQTPQQMRARAGMEHQIQRAENSTHRGGTRKYVQGTEGFWKEMFWRARNENEGTVGQRFKAGIATHPGSRAFYANRPAGIDEVILKAIQVNFPVPVEPQAVTAAWRDTMSWVLNRTEPGIYITPAGVKRIDHSQYADHSDQPVSQILILRSNRLREVDFESKVPNPNSVNSPNSALHGDGRKSFSSVLPTSLTGPFGPRPPTVSDEKNLSFLISRSRESGTLGSDVRLSQHDGVVSGDGETIIGFATDGSGDQLRRHSNTSTGDTIGKETNLQPNQSTWRGLPPPLTTRSRKRKMSGYAQNEQDPSKRRRNGSSPIKENQKAAISASRSNETSHQTANYGVEADESNGTLLTLDASNSSHSIERQPVKMQTRSPQLPKRAKENGKDIIRKIILEVIQDCGGMIPNEFLSVSDYLNRKWHDRGKSGNLEKRTCLEVIKSLCAGGKIKKLSFTYRRKTGSLTTKSLLTNLDVDATSEAVVRLQQNIINALPDLYVPPLGSVLDVPCIEAPAPESEHRNLHIDRHAAQKPNYRRTRLKHGFRKDILGASAARNPFKSPALSNAKSIGGSRDLLTRAFTYLSSIASPNGQPIWLNMEGYGSEEGAYFPETWTTAPISRFNISSPLQRHSRGSAVVSSLSRGKKPNSTGPASSLTPKSRLYEELNPEEPLYMGTPKFGRSSRGRKIIWKNRDSEVLPPALPTSIEDIIDMPGQIKRIDYSMTEDPETNDFLWILDAVENWELNILKIYQQKASNWTFINHISDQRAMLTLENSSQLVWEEPNVLTTATFVPQPTYITRVRSIKAPKAKTAKSPFEHDDDESLDSDYNPTAEADGDEVLARGQRRASFRKNRRSAESSKNRSHTRRTLVQIAREKGEKWERQGRPRILKNMSATEVYRIVIAVILVRTLVGGIGSDIDWSIVKRMCPGRDETFLADRWNTLIVRNRQDIANLTASMQMKYVDACEKDEVACIDFDNVHNSNWESILSWAEKNLDKNVSGNVEHLCSSREELLQHKNFSFDEPQTLREALSYPGNQIKALKEEIWAGLPAAVPLPDPNREVLGLRVEAEVEEEDPRLSLAKSWTISTVNSPQDSINVTKITQKLSKISSTGKKSDDLIEKALRSLQRNLVVKRSNRNSTTSSVLKGGWHTSERWFEAFQARRMITATMLRTAANWKRDVLDLAAAKAEGVQIGQMDITADGEMVAIINLVAKNRCKITAGPAGLPQGRYGLDPDAKNYSTKGMSRLLTVFATTLTPVAGKYVAGDPMASQRLEIPGWQDNGNGKIPCWIDVNGHVLHDIWDMVVCAVVGLLSGRSGIQALEIERTLNHGLAGWEIRIVLDWLIGGGFARRTEKGGGYETEEWWWLVCWKWS